METDKSVTFPAKCYPVCNYNGDILKKEAKQLACGGTRTDTTTKSPDKTVTYCVGL